MLYTHFLYIHMNIIENNQHQAISLPGTIRSYGICRQHQNLPLQISKIHPVMETSFQAKTIFSVGKYILLQTCLKYKKRSSLFSKS